MSQVEDAGGDPSTERELVQVIGGFMVSTNEDRKDRSDKFAAVVLVERVHRSILRRTRQTVQIRLIPHRLEVPTAHQQVNLDTMLLFHRLQRAIDGFQFPVRASFKGDPHWNG